MDIPIKKHLFPFKLLWLLIGAPIFTILLESIVGEYIDNEIISSFLQKTVSWKILLPIFVFLVFLVICLSVYVYRIKKDKSKVINNDELKEINELINDIAEEYNEVESVQAYQYFLGDNDKNKYIKTSFLTGFANEGIEINSILQGYYTLSYVLNKKIKKFSEAYDRYHKNVTSPEDTVYAHTEYMKWATEICCDLSERLNKLSSVEEIENYHYDEYRILVVLSSIVHSKGVESVLENQDVECALISKKRTGLLGTIILHRPYFFKNCNSLTKKRVYLCLPYNSIKKKRIILLLAINNDPSFEDADTSIDVYCKAIIDRVNDMLQEKGK